MGPPPVRPPHGPRKSEEHYLVDTDPRTAIKRGGIIHRLTWFLFKFRLVDWLMRFYIAHHKNAIR